MSETDLHRWTVAAAVIETDDGVLMVRNRRRGGRHDWTPPGGVVESSEEILDALAREVREETGLIVGSWGPLLYEVEAVAPDLGWHLRALIFPGRRDERRASRRGRPRRHRGRRRVGPARCVRGHPCGGARLGAGTVPGMAPRALRRREDLPVSPRDPRGHGERVAAVNAPRW
ncbi:MAG: NUDIX hydrolase [Actinobacteria bacterium]|nr:NUDIX hydrolase [Actinomycetota bacterium]